MTDPSVNYNFHDSVSTTLDTLHDIDGLTNEQLAFIHDVTIKIKKLLCDHVISKELSGSLYEKLYKENVQLYETQVRREYWIRQAKEQAGYKDTVSFDVVWEETLKKAQATILPEYTAMKHDILREIDIGANKDYLVARQQVAALSGVPAMALTFDEHCAVIKSKLNNVK